MSRLAVALLHRYGLRGFAFRAPMYSCLCSWSLCLSSQTVRKLVTLKSLAAALPPGYFPSESQIKTILCRKSQPHHSTHPTNHTGRVGEHELCVLRVDWYFSDVKESWVLQSSYVRRSNFHAQRWMKAHLTSNHISTYISSFLISSTNNIG